jgi:hypothetical protein
VSAKEICSTIVAEFSLFYYISNWNVSPMEICSTNVAEFSSYIVYQ